MKGGKAIFHILALIIVGIWGITFVSTKVLIHAGLAPAQIFMARFVIAYLGMWVIAFCRKDKPALFSNSLKDELLMVLVGITGGSMYFLTENTALEYTQACNVSFLVSTAPLMTLFLTAAVRKLFSGRIAEGQQHVRFNGFMAAGTLLALAGMALVIFEGNKLHVNPKGDLLALAAALCWGFYSIFMGVLSRDYDSLFITRKIFFYGLLTIIPVLFTCEPVPMSTLLQPSVSLNIVFLGIVASLLCYLGWNIIMAKLGNVTSTNYVYLNPFFTLLFAVMLLGERLTPLSAAGSVAIVLGVVLAGRGSSN